MNRPVSLREPPRSGTLSWAFSITHGSFNLRFNIEHGSTPSTDSSCWPIAVSEPPADGATTDDGTQAFQWDSGIHPVSEREYSSPINFWDALDSGERRRLMSLAERRTFAPGARLMRQGELADHVAVLSSGRVRVSVRDSGRQHTLAERGAGDLIGERAALRAGLRSATVVALERVQALLLSTADFAAFVSEYPTVLRILEDQMFDRLTEGPAWPDPGTAQLCGQNCTIVYTDVVGFGAPSRTDHDRLVIRQATTDMTAAALGPFWVACSCDDRGDGLLIVVPPDIPTMAVLDRLITVLPSELAKHNTNHQAPVRVQLRVAVIVGPIVADTMGVSGEAIIRAARMLEAAEFKQAMKETEISLGLIVSGFVYETAIRHAADPLEPGGFTRIEVKVKESEMTAWMHFVSPVVPVPDGMSRVDWRAALRRSPFLAHLLAG
jgi:hypothetical protein